MKKILFISALVLLSINLSAQSRFPRGIKVGKTSGVVEVDSIVLTGNAFKIYSGGTLLSPGFNVADTMHLSDRINLKVNIADTASMLTKYLHKTDTTSMLTKYLHKSDTTSMLTKYARLKSPTITTPSFTTSITIQVGDTTVTAAYGKIVFKTSDSTFYGCKFKGTGKKHWYKLDN